MTYRPPLRDLEFVLNSVVGFDRLEQSGAFPDLSSDLVSAILEEAGKFASEELEPLNVSGDEIGATLQDGNVKAAPGFKETYQKFVESGFGSLPFDPEYGGQGLPNTMALALIEFWSSANISWSLAPMLSEGANKAIFHHGTEEQKATFLPKLISGEWTGTMCLTEAQAGSDVGALRSKAEKLPDGTYLIKGTKIFITWGDHDLTDNIIHLVLARLPDGPAGTKGISLFIVPKFLINEDGSPGAPNDVQCLKLEEKLGIHASPTCVLEFGDNQGSVGYLLGEENRGMACMFTMMNSARLNVGMQGLSVAEMAYQKALDYAEVRVQGKPMAQPQEGLGIIGHADIRRSLLHMKSHVEAARAICYANAVASDMSHAAVDENERTKAKGLEELLTPISKGWSTDIGFEVASLGVQIHGGMGYIEETGAAQYLRDVRITSIYEGTNGIQAIDLATRKLGLAGGQVMADFVVEIGRLAGELKDHAGAKLAAIGNRLDHASEVLQETFTWMRGQAKDNPQNIMAGATPYLRLFGNVTGGYFLAKGALAAHQKISSGEGDKNYLAARIVLAQYFADNVLPLSQGLAESVTAGAETLYELSAEQLAL